MRRLNRATALALIFLLGALVARLYLTVCNTETGLESLRNQWRGATIGWFVEDIPLHQQLPVDQAKFWLKEVDRIVAEYPNDPEILMGAAMVLDSPCQDFALRIRQATARDNSNKFIQVPFALDPARNQIEQAESEFEALSGRKAVDLANRAVLLDGKDPNWRRLRANLLKARGLYTYAQSPRDPNWLSQLEQDSQLDKESAIYDCMMAEADLEASLKFHFDKNRPDTPRVQVVSEEQFQRGLRSFAEAQQKPKLAMGAKDAQIAFQFLRRSRATKLEQIKVLESRLMRLRQSSLVLNLWRIQQKRALSQIDAGKPLLASQILEANAGLIEQWIHGDDHAKYNALTHHLRAASQSLRHDLVVRHPDQFPGARVSDVERLRFESKVDEAVIKAAAEALNKSGPARPATSLLQDDPWRAVIVLASGIASSIALILLPILLLAHFTLRFCGELKQQNANLLMPLALLGAAFAISVAAFGLAPARVIPGEAQHWVATISLLALPPILISVFIWRALRARRFRYSLAKVFLVVTFISILLGGFVMLRGTAAFQTFPFTLEVPSRATAPGFETQWNAQMDRFPLPWQIAIHWLAYQGPYLTIAIWAALLALIQARLVLHPREELGEMARAFASGFARKLARSSLLLFVVSLGLYCALAPTAIELAESDYQWKSSFAHNPQWHLNRARTAVSAIRKDAAQMAEINKSVKEEIAQEDAAQLSKRKSTAAAKE